MQCLACTPSISIYIRTHRQLEGGGAVSYMLRFYRRSNELYLCIEIYRGCSMPACFSHRAMSVGDLFFACVLPRQKKRKKHGVLSTLSRHAGIVSRRRRSSGVSVLAIPTERKELKPAHPPQGEDLYGTERMRRRENDFIKVCTSSRAHTRCIYTSPLVNDPPPPPPAAAAPRQDFSYLLLQSLLLHRLHGPWERDQ